MIETTGSGEGWFSAIKTIIPGLVRLTEETILGSTHEVRIIFMVIRTLIRTPILLSTYFLHCSRAYRSGYLSSIANSVEIYVALRLVKQRVEADRLCENLIKFLPN